MHISKVRLPFYPPRDVKCGLQNRVSIRGDFLFSFLRKRYTYKREENEL